MKAMLHIKWHKVTKQGLRYVFWRLQAAMVWCNGVVVELLGTVPPQGFKALVRRMLFLDPDPHAYITQVASLSHSPM